jgi:hypothetical protein
VAGFREVRLFHIRRAVLPHIGIGEHTDGRPPPLLDDGGRQRHTARGGSNMLVASTTGIAGIAVVLAFTFLVVGFAIYALVRPFTHTSYHRAPGTLIEPLD